MFLDTYIPVPSASESLRFEPATKNCQLLPVLPKQRLIIIHRCIHVCVTALPVTRRCQNSLRRTVLVCVAQVYRNILHNYHFLHSLVRVSFPLHVTSGIIWNTRQPISERSCASVSVCTVRTIAQSFLNRISHNRITLMGPVCV